MWLLYEASDCYHLFISKLWPITFLQNPSELSSSSVWYLIQTDKEWEMQFQHHILSAIFVFISINLNIIIHWVIVIVMIEWNRKPIQQNHSEKRIWIVCDKSWRKRTSYWSTIKFSYLWLFVALFRYRVWENQWNVQGVLWMISNIQINSYSSEKSTIDKTLLIGFIRCFWITIYIFSQSSRATVSAMQKLMFMNFDRFFEFSMVIFYLIWRIFCVVKYEKVYSLWNAINKGKSNQSITFGLLTWNRQFKD